MEALKTLEVVERLDTKENMLLAFWTAINDMAKEANEEFDYIASIITCNFEQN